MKRAHSQSPDARTEASDALDSGRELLIAFCIAVSIAVQYISILPDVGRGLLGVAACLGSAFAAFGFRSSRLNKHGYRSTSSSSLGVPALIGWITPLCLLLLTTSRVLGELVYIGDLRSALGQTVLVLIPTVTIMIGFYFCLKRGRSSALIILGSSSTIYVLLNVGASLLGVEHYDPTRTGWAIADSTRQRWLPPFSGGPTLFVGFVSVGIASQLLLVFDASSRKSLSHLGRITHLLAIFLSGAACFMAETRAGVIVVVYAVVWVLWRSMAFRSLLALCASLMVFVVPALFYDLNNISRLDSLIPDFALSRLSRSAADIMTLNGRAYIYNYAFELLDTGALGTVGQGPLKRNAAPAMGLLHEFADYGSTGKRYSFHNGIMDVLVIHGPYITVLVILGFFVSWVGIVFKLLFHKRLANSKEASEHIKTLLLYFSVVGIVNVSSVLEAGYSDPVKLSVLSGLSLVAWHHYRSASSGGLKTSSTIRTDPYSVTSQHDDRSVVL